MCVLFIVLNNVDYLEDILAKFVDLGVSGATILDSQGMGSAIVHNNIENIPLFGSLKSLLTGSHPYNKTIFTVIESDELQLKVVKAVKEVLESIPQKGAGFMFTVPIGNIYMMRNQ